jgi:hypothetical protein
MPPVADATASGGRAVLLLPAGPCCAPPAYCCPTQCCRAVLLPRYVVLPLLVLLELLELLSLLLLLLVEEDELPASVTSCWID